MATTHAMTVVKNNCYKAPRISNTDLPASMKESKDEHNFSQSSEVSEENLDDVKWKKTHTTTIGRHDKDRNIHSYKKEDYVSDEQFYQNLIKLREEHKKTLKLLETRYYEELKKQNSFQWEGFVQGVGLQEYNGVVNGSMDEMEGNGNILESGHGKTGVTRGYPKSPVQDIVKDMSQLTNDPAEEHEHDSSEASDENEAEEKEILSSPEEFSSSIYPKRSAAVDMVEHLWKDFSVKDYTVDNDSIEEQAMKLQPKEKEWTPSITVPKPFTMTLRHATKEKRKTRSMQMLENDLVLKKSMEEAELKKKFRAQPVPATTFIPLYDDIVDKNKRRSEHIREINKAILKATEKPFSFIKREEMKKHQKEAEKRKAIKQKAKEETDRALFKAKPPPKHMDELSLVDRLTEQDEYRKIRKKLRAAELLAKSRLPPSMEARANVTPAAKTRQKCRKSREHVRKPQFRPKINPEVPDFDALHWEFEKELRRRKKEKQPTVVEPFNLQTAHIPRAKSSLRRARSMENLSRSIETPTIRTRKDRPYSARLSSSQDTLPFGTTESVRLRDNAVRKSLEVQKQRNDETLKARKEKQKREKKLRSQVTVKAMANDHSWKLRKSSEQKLKSFRESERDRQEEYERELFEMRRRVEQRPLLFERESQANAKRKAEKKYTQILRDAGVHDDLVNKLVTRDGDIVDTDSEDSETELEREDFEGHEGLDNEYLSSENAVQPESGSDDSEPAEISDEEFEDDS